MSSARTSVLFTLFVSLGLAVAAAPPAKPDKSAKGARPTKAQIAQWVRDLGDNDFDVREQATRKLWEAGEPAMPSLTAALKSDDAEVVRRAQEILDKFKFGIFPDTPKTVVEILARFHGSDANKKSELVRELFEAGPGGCKALPKLMALEENVQDKQAMVIAITHEMPRVLPLLSEKDYPTVDALLELCLGEEGKYGILNAAAWWLLRGQLDQKIAHYKALETKGPNPKEKAEILAYLYRAKGDLPAALAAAQRADVPFLVEPLAFEAGDWKELAKLAKPQFEIRDRIEQLSHRAAYLRLAGKKKEFEETIAAIRKEGEDALMKQRGPDQSMMVYAKALFLNQRPAEALDLLTRNDADLPAAFEILVAQLKYAEAFALVEKVRKANDKSRLPQLEILQARALYNLGEKDKATAVFARCGEQIKAGQDNASWYDTLVDTEIRLGLTDQAFEHAGRVLRLPEGDNWHGWMLGKLFPNNTETAENLWAVLKVLFPLADTQANLKRLREALGGKLAAKDLGRWIDNVQNQVQNQRPEVAERWWRALGEAAVACKQEEQARQCLEKSGTMEALLLLADQQAAKKDWERAADLYFRAWEKNRLAALPLYLSGKALVTAGKIEAGKKRIEQAHWLPLGDVLDSGDNQGARTKFADALARRGETEALQRENDLLLKLSQPNSFNYGKALRRAGFAAAQRKDLLRSADLQERATLHCLRSHVSFLLQSANVVVPAMLCRQRAVGLLAAGKTREALEMVALCQEYMPANVDVVVQVTPELDRLGQKKEAGELFARTIAVYEKLCREHPNCAWAHNSVAWLSATCRRNLDDGLTHAQKAVELAPKASGHWDTLGEVYFQRGDKDKAVEIARKVVAMEPKRAYFRKQLKRIQAGDPKAPLPPENDDEEDD